MKSAPIPPNEADRIKAVEDLNILDTKNEKRFDDITSEAIRKFSVPISTVTIIDRDREWFKSSEGMDKKEGPRDISFCGHALLSELIYIVEDTLKDSTFADNPMVIGEPFIRFYAGKSLLDRKTGLPIGVFCIKDTKPRTMTLPEIDEFLKLALRAEDEINKKV